MSSRRSIRARYLGRIGYGDALAMQERVLAQRIAKECPDTLLLLEHNPVVTMGRGADAANILASPEVRAQLGIELFETGRGGDVTYHGPGQLVAYPIFDLKPDRCDVRRYVRDLGEVMVRLAADFGVGASFVRDDPKMIGVWVDPEHRGEWREPPSPHIRKIGAIGVRLSRWVTMHGLAFNASTDLTGFDLIVPCGIRTHGVTSLEALGIAAPPLETLAQKAAAHFGAIFEADVDYALGVP